jgi:Tfp pilus assembly protein PilX
MMTHTSRYRASLGNEKGMVLVVGLLLIVVLLILGTTAVITSTTDMKISANYKTGNQAFYAAEAGIEEARGRLKLNAADPITDNYPTQTQWAAFIGAEGKAQGKGYDSGNSMHVRVASLQSTLDYTVKIQHRTNAGGQILYWGDANGDGIYERNTLTGKNIYLVTSYGAASGANRTIEVEMTRLPPITVPGPLYVESPTAILGTSTNIIGIDQCGGASTPGIVTTLAASTITNSGNPTVCGITAPTCNVAGTWSVVGGATNMDVQAMIDAQKDAANFVYDVNNDTHSGMNWGTPTPGATLQNSSSCAVNNIVHYRTGGTAIRLSGGSQGCGILLVEGNLELSGDFSWYGVVVVTGSVVITGGGHKNITGGVISGGSAIADVVGGNANIVFCSSAINNLAQSQPLRRLSWKEQNI